MRLSRLPGSSPATIYSDGEVQFALPKELNEAERREVASRFAEGLTSGERLPYTMAIHRGGPNGENPHAHLMFSERGNDGIERSAEQWFRRYNAKAPEKGGVGDIMRNSINKESSSRFAALSRSGGGVHAVKFALCTALLAATAGAQRSADWRIDTFAGSGEHSYSGFGGFGGDATEARLKWPKGVAVDGAGNLYIADSLNRRVRKVDSAGTITTIAGTGDFRFSFGFDGDGGPATEAQLRFPTGVAMDGAGNLYIADYADHRIRKVDSAGTITTIAGSGWRRRLRSALAAPAHAGGNGRCGQPLHRRFAQPPGPQGGLLGDHQHRRGHGTV